MRKSLKKSNSLKPELIGVSLRMPLDLLATLDKIAMDSNRSRSQQIVFFLNERCMHLIDTEKCEESDFFTHEVHAPIPTPPTPPPPPATQYERPKLIKREGQPEGL